MSRKSKGPVNIINSVEGIAERTRSNLGVKDETGIVEERFRCIENKTVG